MIQIADNTPEQSKAIGKPMDRVDARLKVTGKAQFSAEIPLQNLVHAVLVGSAIANGRIIRIDTKAAEQATGVLKVITPFNMVKLAPVKTFNQGGSAAEDWSPLQDKIVHYSGQHIAIVLADTLEHAEYAAALIKPEYQTQPPRAEFDKVSPVMPKGKVAGKPADVTRGNPTQGIAQAAVKIEQTYRTPIEHNNPMETHATTVVWEGDQVTVYDSTQYNFGTRQAIATAFGIPEDRVRVVCKFIGGGFGCKGAVWSHTLLAAAAAREIKRPVKLVLTREQMFTSVGHRAETEQKVVLGATKDGKLTAISHTGKSHTAEFSEFVEPFTNITHMLYATPNLQASQRLVPLNINSPAWMRAPGESPGTFALESAMDELAYALKLDPIELRLRNYADTDPDHNRPWSSKSLEGMLSFGARRNLAGHDATRSRDRCATRALSDWHGYGRQQPIRCICFPPPPKPLSVRTAPYSCNRVHRKWGRERQP